ncbi:MAG: glutamyl-tRNA reductase [Acidobacteriota bacterium]
MGIFLVGINHRTAPVELRERLAFADSSLPDALQELVDSKPIVEGLIVSTCNRVEIIAATENAGGVAHLYDFLERYHGCHPDTLEGHCYSLADIEAVRHVFRVTSSLDSMIVGEPQITGQIKDAFQVAQDARTVGHQLNRLMSRAFAVAKRVRNETGIGSSAVSVSFVAVELARRVFETLKGATVLLLGAGEMAELAARHLKSYGVGRILIANRTPEKAAQLAAEMNGEPIPFSGFENSLAQADIVLCSTGAPHYLINAEHVRQALNARRNRPILLIDISVPRNVDPAISSLDNAFVFDIDDLENVVASNLQVREQEAARAEAIVDAEAERFVASLADGDINEIIGSFRREVGLMVQSELQRSRKRLGELSPDQEDAIRVLLNAVVNRLTLPVIRQLRESDEGHSNYLEAWRQLSQRDRK